MTVDIKLFAVGAALGVLAAVTPGCGHQSPTSCNAETCASGCCSADDECVTVINSLMCGAGGERCVMCAASDVCVEGQCVPDSIGAGGGKGSGGAGGVGTGGGGHVGTGGGGHASTGGGTAGTGGGTAGTGGGTAGTGGGTAGTGGGTAGTGGGGGGLGAGGGSGTAGGNAAVVSAQLEAVRAAADATPGVVSLPVTGALVTYTVPTVPGGYPVTTPAGFFVQAEAGGPAVFVGIESTKLTPPPEVGDVVSFTVFEVRVASSQRRVLGVSDYTRLSSGNAIDWLVEPVDGVDFTSPAALDAHESELVSLTGTVFGVARKFGNTQVYGLASLATAGTAAAPFGPLGVRMPTTLIDSEDITVDCTLSITNAPVWRLDDLAQPMVRSATAMAGTICPEPRVVRAVAYNDTEVRVVFDRQIDAASLTPGAFSFAGGALVTTSVSRLLPHQVVLTTTPQTLGAQYTLNVAAAVRDTRGRSVDRAHATAAFSAARANDCTAPVVISQVYTSGGLDDSAETYGFVELHNRTAAPVDLTGWSLQYQGGVATGTWPGTSFRIVFTDGVIAPGGYFLLQADSKGTVDVGPLSVAPDLVTSLNMDLNGGKLALVDNATPLVGCPLGAATDAGVVDFVGYGNTNCAESGSPTEGSKAEGFTAATALQRQGLSGPQQACRDTNANEPDFKAVAPMPRNSASPANICTCP